MSSSYLKIFVLPVAAILFSVLYFSYSPYQFSYPGCTLHALTGYFCPACGSQRAFSDLLHGRVVEALHNNVLFILGIPVFVLAYLRLIRVRGPEKISFIPALPPSAWWMILALIMIFWVLRNLPLFSFLAPLSR